MDNLHKVLIKLFRTYKRKARCEFSKIGLSEGQPQILDFLVKNNGCIQRELAESCRIEPATVTCILSTMEKKKLIYRSQNIENRRILNVFVTESGIVAQKKESNMFNNLDELCFYDFSEEEKIATIKLLNNIINNLEGKNANNN